MRGLSNDKIIEVEFIEPERDLFAEIQLLKQQLTDTDYVACKIAEGSATIEDYAELIAQRQEWRKEINRLESEVQ